MNKKYSQHGTAVNRTTYIISLGGRRIRLVADFHQIMAMLPLIQAVRQTGRAVA